jgi:2-polyprenyl-3-methyl-5-hydroxy-6-metoxy-1,4-benzoquinol methylase
MLPGFTPFIKRQADKILELSGLKPGDRVLEVGCGMGRHTFYLAEKGIKIEGLDLTPGLLEQLRKFDGGRYQIPLHCGDVLDFTAQLAGKFDGVIGFFVLHHLFDLETSIQAMAQLAKPGGRLAFIEPNPMNPLYYVQIALVPGMSWKAERGLINMRYSVIARAMRSAGLAQPIAKSFGFLPRFITNQKWGSSLENLLDRVGLLDPIRPFQFFGAQR